MNRRVGCGIGTVKKNPPNDASPQSDRTKDCIVGFALGPRLILLAVFLGDKGYGDEHSLGVEVWSARVNFRSSLVVNHEFDISNCQEFRLASVFDRKVFATAC